MSLPQQDAKFVQNVELAVRFGRVLIATEVDYIEPVLVNLLRRDFQMQGARLSVLVGDKMLDVADSFRLFFWPSFVPSLPLRLRLQ